MYIPAREMYISAAGMYISAAEINFTSKERQLYKRRKTAFPTGLSYFITCLYRTRKRYLLHTFKKRFK